MFNIKNIVFRTYKSQADLQSMINVLELCSSKDKVDLSSTLESIPSTSKLKESFVDDHCNPTQDILIVEYEDRVIGYSKVSWWFENDGTALFLHVEYLIPEFRTTELWQMIIDWVENRIKLISSDVKSNNKFFGANASSTEKEKTEILLKNNYKKVFSLVEMIFDDFDNIQEPLKIPDGFSLKDVKDNDLRLIWETNNEVYKNRDYILKPTEEDFRSFANNKNNDFSLWKVAYFGDKIAGFVIGAIKNNRGEIEEVSILPEYRRKGLSYFLLVSVLQEFKNKNINIVYIHTNGENVSGARSLYNKVGFKYNKDFVKYRKSLSLK